MRRIAIRSWSSTSTKRTSSSIYIPSSHLYREKLRPNRKGASSHSASCGRFDQYVFGREITVETDHKPLEVILKKPLLAAPKRLQRMMMQLQKYNLRVVYKRGSEMYIADTLSTAYLSAPNQVSEEEPEFVRAVENVKMTKHLSISPERLQEIQEKIRDDVTLQDLKKNIKNGWPDQRSKVLPRTRAYYKFRDELSVQGGVLFKGERVIVPMVM